MPIRWGFPHAEAESSCVALTRRSVRPRCAPLTDRGLPRPVAGGKVPLPVAGGKVPRPVASGRWGQPTAGIDFPQPVAIPRWSPRGY
jgi:hypothetical protein